MTKDALYSFFFHVCLTDTMNSAKGRKYGRHAVSRVMGTINPDADTLPLTVEDEGEDDILHNPMILQSGGDTCSEQTATKPQVLEQEFKDNIQQ